MKTKPKSTPQRKQTPDGEEMQLLRHDFTKDELLDLSRQQNSCLNKIGELESQMASVVKDFKAKIQSEEGRVNELRNHINSGYMMQPQRVRVEYHPTEGKKFFFALDDAKKKKKLGESPMTPADYETGMTPLLAQADAEKDRVQKKFLDECLEVFRAEGKASFALLQRRLKISFKQANEAIDLLVKSGDLSKITEGGIHDLIAKPEPAK